MNTDVFVFLLSTADQEFIDRQIRGYVSDYGDRCLCQVPGDCPGKGEWAPMKLSDTLYIYLVNKPLSAAGISEDSAQGRKIVQKINSWLRSEASRAIVKF